MATKQTPASIVKKKSASSPHASNSEIKLDKPVIASITVRLLAGLYDLLLILALVFVIGVALIVIGSKLFLTNQTQVTELPALYQYLAIFPSYLLATWGFYAVFWRKAGQTLGMQTWRLKTISAQGHLLTWSQSFLRCTAACLIPCICATITYVIHHTPMAVTFSLITGFLLNYVLALFNDKHLAAHDILSATLTVRMPAKAEGKGFLSWFKK